ncbi:putative 26S proteasome regulatory subunit [Malassezia yamatoensis]|uniref:26S proteasome regulatory subunit n=1 Tax=Malassezia yamatoensis TaxID=253288 RepID=A0AAJ5YQ84_9BASI|nr:putative 26S proteasome regulatory subunit [Malassezia yamatoensis]
MEIQARSDAIRLEDQRKRIDAEILAQNEVLELNKATMTSPLVDAEGFPLAGVDLGGIRKARQQIRMLVHDRQQVDAQLKSLLEHALAKKPASSASSESTPAAGRVYLQKSGKDTKDANDVPETTLAATDGTMDTDTAQPILARPIAVRSVSPKSPASAAGLRAGDVLTSFGDFQSLSSANFSELPSQLRDGTPISVGVNRVTDNGLKQLLTLTLTPSTSWGGRGLLGYVRDIHAAVI